MNNKDYIEHMNKYVPTISIDEIRNIAIRFRGDDKVTAEISNNHLVITGDRYNSVCKAIEFTVLVDLSMVEVPYSEHVVSREHTGTLGMCGLSLMSDSIEKLLLNQEA